MFSGSYSSAISNAAQNAAPCSTPEYRQLDFWVGDWDLKWDAIEGSVPAGAGKNIITKSEFGTCVIQENFSSPAFGGVKGMSVSTYFAPAAKWRQTWVDNGGGYFALVGGPVEGKSYSFELVNSRLSETEPHLRMIWEDVTEDSLTWRWQNRASETDNWKDGWVIKYTRAKPAEEG
jgi:hypothetical protein